MKKYNIRQNPNPNTLNIVMNNSSVYPIYTNIPEITAKNRHRKLKFLKIILFIYII